MSVCEFGCTLGEKWLELLSPKLAESMASPKQVLILRSEVQSYGKVRVRMGESWHRTACQYH